jgi:hypothetical protein
MVEMMAAQTTGEDELERIQIHILLFASNQKNIFFFDKKQTKKKTLLKIHKSMYLYFLTI